MDSTLQESLSLHSSSVKKNPSKTRYLEKHFYMLPWCIFLEHWIRVFSHHIINCLYDIHHFLPWQHASTNTKRKLREMIAHFYRVLPCSSPSFSCGIPAPGIPVRVHGDRCTRHTNSSCRKNCFSLPLPCHSLPVLPPLPWPGSDTAGAGSKGCAHPLGQSGTNSVPRASSRARGPHSWNWESGPSPHLAQIAPPLHDQWQ